MLPAVLPPEQHRQVHPQQATVPKRKTCPNGKRTCLNDKRKKPKKETQRNRIPQAALLPADTTAQTQLHQQLPAAQQVRQNHEYINKQLRISSSRSAVARQSLGSRSAVAQQSLGSRSAVALQSLGSRLAVARQLLGSGSVYLPTQQG